MIVGLVSEDGSMDMFDLRDYLVSVVQPVIARVPGAAKPTSSAANTPCASGSTRTS